ncbi:BtrH N-terminal domain-containing protein [Ruminococcus sp.]|uniref:BtrH N-terminal domain-containing protein n=1 Tax=Ruminococcus sp. TaxID=41978 RepID=UPI003890820C
MFITGDYNRRSYNCYSGNVCYLLERKGFLLSEHMSFGMCGGLSFQFELSDSVKFRAVRELHCLTEYLYNLGMKIVEKQSNEFDDFCNQIKISISNDMPFMFHYDGFYFPFTQIYKKTHERRIALVTGFDDLCFFVSDFIYGVYDVEVNLDVFRQATDKFKGACVNYTYYDVLTEELDRNTVNGSNIWNSIGDVSNHFLREESENILVGIKGLREIYSAISACLERNENAIDWADFSEDINQAVITLDHYGLFLEEIACKQLVQEKYIEKILTCSKLFMEASDMWQIVTRLFFKLSVNSSEKTIERIKINIDKTADILEQAFTLLDEMVKENV